MDRHYFHLDDPHFQGRLRRHHTATVDIRWQINKPHHRISDISAPQKPVLHKTSSHKAHTSRSSVIPAAALHSRKKSKVLLRETAASRPQVGPSELQSAINETRVRQPLGLKLLYSMAIIVFLLGVGASLIGVRTNQKAEAQVQKITTKVTPSDAPPSTTKPTEAQLRAYSVAPDLPRYIDIPKLKVHARVYPAGVTKTGALAVPSNIYNADWYKNSSKPGQTGAMLIDGHSGLNADGVFNNLDKLKVGNPITITRGDGKAFTYLTVKSQLYAADNVDMASLLVSANTAKPGLNLITCAGDPIPGTFELNKRIAVFAVLQ